MLRALLLSLFCSFYSPGDLSAQDAAASAEAQASSIKPALEAAQKALEAKDYPGALAAITPAAQSGDREAMYFMGMLYEKGLGVAQNINYALSWYEPAAAKGEPRAALKVGYAYQTGIGKPINPAEAQKWFSQAAKDNNDKAQYIVGSFYMQEKNYAEAHKAFLNSALQGNAEAQFEMGNIYFEGNGVPQNYNLSMKWFKLSANQGYTPAQMRLGDLYSTATKGVILDPISAHAWYNLVAAYGSGTLRDEAIEKRNALVPKMQPQMIVIAQNHAKNWKKKLRKDSIPRIKRAGTGGADGNDLLDLDLPDANPSTLQSLAQASIQNSANGKSHELNEPIDLKSVRLGLPLEKVKESVRSRNLSLLLPDLLALADKDNTEAMVTIGDIYAYGSTGLPVNYSMAGKWYHQAATKRDPVGQAKLATLFCEGQGTEPNPIQCYKWFLLAFPKLTPPAAEVVKDALQKLNQSMTEDEVNDAKYQAQNWNPNRPAEPAPSIMPAPIEPAKAGEADAPGTPPAETAGQQPAPATAPPASPPPAQVLPPVEDVTLDPVDPEIFKSAPPIGPSLSDGPAPMPPPPQKKEKPKPVGTEFF